VPDDFKVTRFQLINSAGMAAFNFSVDGHALWVLALDGQPVVPQKVTDLLVNVAQRVDLAVCRIKKT
jgi:FtsP/CotA-like multicopper oxidase with cupredoxin domain